MSTPVSRVLACPGWVLGLALVAAMSVARPAAAMFFEVRDDKVIVFGEVQLGDYERLLARLNEGKITTLVLRNSPGGLLIPTWHMMRLIRERNLRTAVMGYCVSACAHLFIAGRERHFTDVPGSFVGFHGAYDSSTGIISIAQADTQKQQILGLTEGKVDPALIDRWTYIRNARGFMAFYNPDHIGRLDGVSIFLCQGHENMRRLFDECEKITGTDAYTSGVATSRDLLRLHLPMPPAAPATTQARASAPVQSSAPAPSVSAAPSQPAVAAAVPAAPPQTVPVAASPAAPPAQPSQPAAQQLASAPARFDGRYTAVLQTPRGPLETTLDVAGKAITGFAVMPATFSGRESGLCRLSGTLTADGTIEHLGFDCPQFSGFVSGRFVTDEASGTVVGDNELRGNNLNSQRIVWKRN